MAVLEGFQRADLARNSDNLTFNSNGGQFTRFTPMINWYLAKSLRWELIYGYGQLNRFNLKGNVIFLKSYSDYSYARHPLASGCLAPVFRFTQLLPKSTRLLLNLHTYRQNQHGHVMVLDFKR
jgi:hypothetical protein